MLESDPQIKTHSDDCITAAMSPAASSIPAAAAGDGIQKKKGSSPWRLLGRMKLSKESIKWRWKFLISAFKWKRVDHRLQVSLLDDFLFKIASVLEGVVLVAAVSFFYLCCGCHF